jgi:prepilin-type N-terminal cleavage/methylation domain-containing protein
MPGKNSGFTLIEIVATMVIVGLVAVAGWSILSNIVEGTLNTRYATAAAEKIQSAFMRISLELANADRTRSITVDNVNKKITYYYQSDSTQSAIQLSGTNLQLVGPSSTGTLVDKVDTATGITLSALPAAGAPFSITLTIPVLVPRWDQTTVSRSYSTTIDLNPNRFH